MSTRCACSARSMSRRCAPCSTRSRPFIRPSRRHSACTEVGSSSASDRRRKLGSRSSTSPTTRANRPRSSSRHRAWRGDVSVRCRRGTASSVRAVSPLGARACPGRRFSSPDHGRLVDPRVLADLERAYRAACERAKPSLVSPPVDCADLALWRATPEGSPSPEAVRSVTGALAGAPQVLTLRCARPLGRDI